MSTLRIAGWSSPVARQAHNLKVLGSNPSPATNLKAPHVRGFLVPIHIQQSFRREHFMKPLDIQKIGNELAIKWDNGNESFILLERLRRCCPCAGCQGEVDILGQLHKGPDKPLPSSAFELSRWAVVGSYAIQPVWADGHSSGLYSFDYLKKVGDLAA